MSQKSVSQKSSTTKSTQPTTRKAPKTFLADDFNIKHFSLTEIDVTNERSKSQMIAYPRYDEATVRFQTPEFQVSQYGLAPIGEYAKSDDDFQRKQLKLVLDPTQEGCVALNDMFTSIDKYMLDSQKKIFTGKLSKLKFSYKSVVREPQVQDDLIDDEEDSKKTAGKEKKEKYNFWKAKLDTDFDTGKILTTVFIRDPENPTAKPKRVPVDTPTQLEQFFRWGSKVRMIVMMNKMWADKQPKEAGSDRKFGLGFKVMSLEITPSERQGLFRTEVQNYAFIDKNEGSGEAEEGEGGGDVEEQEAGGEDQEQEQEQEAGAEAEGEEEEPEEEQEEEPEEEPEEEEEVPQPKAKVAAKKSAPAPVAKKAAPVATKGKGKK